MGAVDEILQSSFCVCLGMEAFNDFLGKGDFDIAWVHAFCDGFLEFFDFFDGLEGKQLIVTPHHIIGNAHELAELDIAGFLDTDVVALGF